MSGVLGGLPYLSGRLSSLTNRVKAPHVHLPEARPYQPWGFRPLDSALEHTVQITDTNAIVATVHHALLPNITTDMLVWWFSHVEGDAVNPGDGKTYAKYLIWHPRDHIVQRTAKQGPSHPHPDGAIWQITEFFMAPEPGYTVSSPPASWDGLINAETYVEKLDHSGLSMTVPSRLGLGKSIWQLRHDWEDVEGGVMVKSKQVVGCAERVAYATGLSSVAAAPKYVNNLDIKSRMRLLGCPLWQLHLKHA
eukprot:jgi/Chrzof1/7875/Cz02g39200.t1